MGPDENRWADAACRGLGKKEQAYFFPKKGRPSNTPKYQKYCGVCPIRLFCLAYALVHDEDGVWGGFTKAERDRLLINQPFLKTRLMTEAKTQGWFENRVPIDEIVQAVRQPEEALEVEQSEQMVEFAVVLDFVIPAQTPWTIDIEPFSLDAFEPPVELQVVAPLPTVPLPFYMESIEFHLDVVL